VVVVRWLINHMQLPEEHRNGSFEYRLCGCLYIHSIINSLVYAIFDLWFVTSDLWYGWHSDYDIRIWRGIGRVRGGGRSGKIEEKIAMEEYFEVKWRWAEKDRNGDRTHLEMSQGQRWGAGNRCWIDKVIQIFLTARSVQTLYYGKSKISTNKFR